MKCPKCGGEYVGHDEISVLCCLENGCDWNAFDSVTAERDALKADNDAHVTVRDKVRAALGCEPHEGVSDAAKRVVSERDALQAQLAALKKRVADAKTIEAKTAWNGETGVCRLFPKRQLQPGTYALLRLEDGEK